MQILRAGAVYLALVFGAGFVPGPVRVLLLVYAIMLVVFALMPSLLTLRRDETSPFRSGLAEVRRRVNRSRGR